MTAMTKPALYTRPSQIHATWQGAPAQTWTVLQRAVGALMARWRPAAFALIRTQFDEYDLAHGARTGERLDVREAGVALSTLVDVAEVLAEGPIDARVAVPAAAEGDTTLWFMDPDQILRPGRLLPAPAVGERQTRWLSAEVSLMRGFSLHIAQRGVIEASWDLGIFAGNEEPSDWKELDGQLDQWLAGQLKALGFQPG
jgi:hypothetical protein